MQDQQTTTLTTVLSEVLANLAFMFTGDGEFDPPVGERWLATKISYGGSVSGALNLTCTATFATRLAANLLGLESEEEASEQESRDAVQEFMNIVCGQYVTAVYGTDDVFNLTIPEVLELSATPVLCAPEDESEDLAILSVDDQWMQLIHTRVA
jgi:chemotaxis protein CheY-P-specific phosphatase CheC